MNKAISAMEVFDTLIGWSTVYPPADADIDEAYTAAPAPVVAAYNSEGVELTVYAPGDELWYNGPKAKRWTIALSDDWAVDFMNALERQGVTETDEDSALWAKVKDLADAVEAGCDKDLATYLDEHPDYNEDGKHWTADNFGFYLID